MSFGAISVCFEPFLRTKRRGLAAVSLLAVSVSLFCCVPPGNGDQAADKGTGNAFQAEGSGPKRPLEGEAFARYVEEGRDSPFGLDYVFVMDAGGRDPQVVRGYAEVVGVRWVNFARVKWDLIEKRRPVGGRHTYDWSLLDEGVKQWQQYGVHIVMSLRLHCKWATAPKSDKVFVYLKGPLKWVAKKTSDYLPKQENSQEFRDIIISLVERNDGDGHKDMPGLRFPVLHYQFGNEYYNEVYWAGSAEEYGKLLREGAKAARLASKDVKILLSGVGFWEVFGFYDRDPTPLTRAYLEPLIQKVPEGMQRFLKRGDAFSRKTITYCDAYDILDARWPNFGFIANCAKLLEQAGCSDKEIWSAEIYSFYPLYEGVLIPNWTIQPYPVPSRSEEYVKILRKKNHRDFPEVNRWYRALQAAQVVKYCMTALHAGSKKLLVGWPGDVQSLLTPYNLNITGMASGTFKKLWPAAYAYKLVIEKLEGFRSIRRLAMPENVYVYECTVKNGKKVLVAFYDDHIGQDPGETLGSAMATIPVESDPVRLTHVVTRIDQEEPLVEHIRADKKKLKIKLSEYPVFLEALNE